MGQRGGLEPGDAEVRHFHGAIIEQNDVRGLDVAMHDAVVVRVLQGVEQLAHDPLDLAHRKALVRLEIVLEGAALDELHGDVSRGGVRAAGDLDGILAIIVDRDDVAVIQTAGRLCFAAQPRQQIVRLRTVEILRDERLQRHPPADHRVEALVHDAHAPATDLAAHFVLAELLRHWSLSLVHAI